MSTAYPGLYGFREVAGLPTTDGRRVRPGVLYRSGTPQFLSTDTAWRLYTATRIRTVVDLRLPHEVDREGSGPLAELPVRHLRVPFQARNLVAPDSAVAPMDPEDPLVTSYLGYLDSEPTPIAVIVTELARPNALPALIHCTVGKDRTGAAVALLLDAIGVCRDAIAADYAAGAAEIAPAMERLRSMASYGDAIDIYPPEAWQAPPEVAVRFLTAVDTRFGGVRALLARHGVDDATLAELTNRLTEPFDTEGESP